jgi:hypothetical protein
MEKKYIVIDEQKGQHTVDCDLEQAKAYIYKNSNFTNYKLKIVKANKKIEV